MLFGRSLLGVIFLLFLARTTGVHLAGQKKGTLILLSCTGTLGIFCLTLALITIPLFQALILFYTYPVLAALISPWLTKDKNSLQNWLCIILAFIGTGLTLWSGQGGHLFLGIGHLSGIMASASMGLTMTLVRRVSSVNSSLTPIFYISVTSILVSILPMLYSDIGFSIPLPGWGWLLAIALFAVSAHIITNKALSYISSAKVGSIGMLEVMFGAVYGYILFFEPLGWSTVLGGTLIIIAGWGLVQGHGRIPVPKAEPRN